VALWFRPPVASPAPLAAAIGVLGFLTVVAWVAWRFGPTLLRISGWSWWWVAWASGSQRGYGYCVAFRWARSRGAPGRFGTRSVAALGRQHSRGASSLVFSESSPVGQREHAVAIGPRRRR
jgi:hypothetical protein